MSARAAAALAATFLVAGCGSSSNGGLTAEEYKQQGNAICRDAKAKIKALQAPKTPTLEDLREKTPQARKTVRAWTAYQEAVEKLSRSSDQKLLDLDPPDSLRDGREQFAKDLKELDKLGAQLNASGERLRRAARSGDDATVEAATQKSRLLGQRHFAVLLRIQKDTLNIGWTACAQA